jgi:hypothetical protein
VSSLEFKPSKASGIVNRRRYLRFRRADQGYRSGGWIKLHDFPIWQAPSSRLHASVYTFRLERRQVLACMLPLACASW